MQVAHKTTGTQRASDSARVGGVALPSDEFGDSAGDNREHLFFKLGVEKIL